MTTLRLIDTVADMRDILMRLVRYELSSDDTRLLVYHCQGEKPTDSLRLIDGYPALPYTCPACGQSVVDPDALRYGFAEVVP